MDDLEERYLEGVEKEGEILLEGLKGNKSLGELEKEYSKKVKEIRKIYEKSLKKELKKEKENPSTKKSKKDKEKTKEFKAEGVELERGWIEDKKIKTEVNSYNFKRKIKNFFYKISPNKIIYLFHRLKIIKINFFKQINFSFKRTFNKISTKVITILTYIKEGFMKVVSEFKRLFSFFSKQKKKEKTEKQEKDKEEKDGNKNK